MSLKSDEELRFLRGIVQHKVWRWAQRPFLAAGAAEVARRHADSRLRAERLVEELAEPLEIAGQDLLNDNVLPIMISAQKIQ